MAQDISSEVKRIIKEQLDVDEKDIKPESSFIDDLGADSLGLVELVLAFEEAFWSTVVGGMATRKTAPGDASTRIMLSGTQVREMLAAGKLPPPELSRPEVARILLDAAQAQPRDRAA